MPKAVGRDRRLKGSAAAFSDNSDGGNNAISMAESGSFDRAAEAGKFYVQDFGIRGPRERDREDASSVPHCGEERASEREDREISSRIESRNPVLTAEGRSEGSLAPPRGIIGKDVGCGRPTDPCRINRYGRNNDFGASGFLFGPKSPRKPRGIVMKIPEFSK